MLDTVICPDVGWLTEKLEESEIPFRVMTISYRPFIFPYSAASLLNFLRTRVGKCIIHVHGRCPLFLSSLTMLLYPALPFVVTVHQFADAGTRGVLSWKTLMETFLMKRMRRICCVSEDLRKEILSRIGQAKASNVQTIPNWIEPYWYQENQSNIRPRSSSKSGCFKICGIGRLVREKGFDILVKSISILIARGYDVTCDIYGDGPEMEALNKQIVDLGMSKSVVLKGVNKEIRVLLLNYDVLVIPSRSESFGITALEAYDAAVPVVASDIEGLRELVINRYSGLSFISGDPYSLANTLSEIMNDKDIRQLLISNGYEVLRRHISNKAFLDIYREFYAKVLSV